MEVRVLDSGPIPWRMRRLAVWLALTQLVTGRHAYVATGCLHGDCGHCHSGQRLDGGTKHPARCKWCPARCRCRGSCTQVDGTHLSQ